MTDPVWGVTTHEGAVAHGCWKVTVHPPAAAPGVTVPQLSEPSIVGEVPQPDKTGEVDEAMMWPDAATMKAVVVAFPVEEAM